MTHSSADMMGIKGIDNRSAQYSSSKAQSQGFLSGQAQAQGR